MWEQSGITDQPHGPEVWVASAKALMVAVVAGTIAELVVQADLPTFWVIGAGLGGVAIEPWIPITWGPKLFDHCLLACIVGSAIMLVVVWLLRLLYHARF